MRRGRIGRILGTLTLIPLFTLLAHGCGVFFLPLASVQSTLRTDLPSFTVDFSIVAAVSDPSMVTSVNWVFGDDAGFEAGGTTISHRYEEAGSYDVSAFVFTATGLLGELTGTVNIAVPQTATDPNPANEAIDVTVNVTLQWTPGGGSPQHDVYLGTDMAAVLAATTASAEYQGQQSAAFFTPPTLLQATTYFWRIDEVLAAGTTTGDVWSFTTALAPSAATDFDPFDLSSGVELSALLSWTAGAAATSHDVYFGTDFASVDAADRSSPEFAGNQTAVMFDPPALSPLTDYFWRIDEVGLGGTTRGGVNTFTTAAAPGQITNPFPADEDMNVSIDLELSWTAGANATSHDVYFGTNENEVTTATSSDPEFKGNQTDIAFIPDDVEANTTYFWRIDEVGPGGTTEGDVISFTTATAPGLATDPDPALAEEGVPLTPTLMWMAGEGAESHDIYLGTSSTAVDNATPGSAEFVSNEVDPMFTPADPLDSATKYFWRVDEVGPGGTTKGSVWNFTTLDLGAASNPDPEHEDEDVPLNQVLTWTAGDGAMSHDVYFGTSENLVAAADKLDDEFQGNFPAAMFTPNLAAGTTYFWRIDEVNADGTVAGVVWMFTTVQTPPGTITNPIPANNADDVTTTQKLSWTAGARAESHDVYFGETMGAVAVANTLSPEFKGNRVTTTYNPGTLDLNTTYFWRIDEKNSAGTTPGTVLSFTTVADVPGESTSPDPTDGATNRNVNTPDGINELLLSWTAGAGAASHDVYFGTNEATIESATTSSPIVFKGNQLGTSYDPGALIANTEYFWRVDEVNGAGTTKGDVFSFRTAVAPGQATAPMPASGAQGVVTPVTLMWTAGANTTSHDVYFGTDSDDVDAAVRQPPSPEFRGNQAGTSFMPAEMLMADTVYFWRIDEIGGGGVTKGQVFSFRTAP